MGPLPQWAKECVIARIAGEELSHALDKVGPQAYAIAKSALKPSALQVGSEGHVGWPQQFGIVGNTSFWMNAFKPNNGWQRKQPQQLQPQQQDVLLPAKTM